MNSRLALAPAAVLYGWAAALRSSVYDHGWIKARQLARPVISVGNLTAGGTGKTPLVELIARTLLGRGITPAILTRGYGRRPGPPLVTLDPAPERSPDPRLAGDEPAMLAAALPEVPIVVASSRFQAGIAAIERYGPDVLLLDDGFQHRQLARRLDIVALDATRPLSDAELIPRGLQRERLSALKRAGSIVLTRCEQGGSAVAQVENLARSVNSSARIYHGQTRLTGWRRLIDGRQIAADAFDGRAVYAFCGIGNPDAFFRDIMRWGLDVKGSRAFRDHHVYTDSEIARLVIAANRSQATLVTTAKDALNLPADWRRTLPAYAALIQAAVIESEPFANELLDALR